MTKSKKQINQKKERCQPLLNFQTRKLGHQTRSTMYRKTMKLNA